MQYASKKNVSKNTLDLKAAVKRALSGIGLCFLVNGAMAYENTGSTLDHDDGQRTIRQSAIEFMGDYYQALEKGLTFEALQSYHSEEFQSDTETLVSKLAKVSKFNPEVEQRRYVDMLRVETSCQSLQLKDNQVRKTFDFRVILSYDIQPLCTDWINEHTRRVKLRYDTGMDQWLIEDIQNIGYYLEERSE